MKIRKDFVTNSSSSSFIIARRKNCTYEEVKNAVSLRRENIKKMLECNGKYIYPENEEIKNNIMSGNIERAVELSIEEIAEKLFDFSGDKDMEIDDWTVYTEELSDEEGYLFNMAMFNIGSLMESENLRIS